MQQKQRYFSDAVMNIVVVLLVLAALAVLVYNSFKIPEVGICQDMKQYQIELLIHNRAQVYYKDCGHY